MHIGNSPGEKLARARPAHPAWRNETKLLQKADKSPLFVSIRVHWWLIMDWNRVVIWFFWAGKNRVLKKEPDSQTDPLPAYCLYPKLC
jgi:hypothetical protein